jgi:hypothetical protein
MAISVRDAKVDIDLSGYRLLRARFGSDVRNTLPSRQTARGV